VSAILTRPDPADSPSSQATDAHLHRGLAPLLFALGGALALNSLLGPLLADAIDYSLSESLRNQLIGLDAVSLILVAPLCLVAGVLVWRGRPAGAGLALGPATYTSYMFVQYVVGPGYQHYPAVLLFHLGLFVLGGVVAVWAWSSLRPDRLPPMTDRTRRVRAGVLLGLAAFVVMRYLPAIVGSVSEKEFSEEFRTEPAFFWTILLMDLGIVVPSAIAAAMALRHGAAVASKAMFAVVGWFALVPPSVAAMGITMVANDDPHASTPATVLFVVAAAVFAGFAVRVFRPLLAGEGHTL